MEQKIFSKLNLYDQLAYLLVGSITIFILFIDFYLFSQYTIPNFNLDTFLLWFIVAYFIGHVVQGLANLINKIPLIKILVKEKKDEFNDSERNILKTAKKYFGLGKTDPKTIWRFCYMFSLAKDVTGHIQLFNAYYSLYRGWLVSLFLESVFLIVYILVFSYSYLTLILLALSLLFAFIFYTRANKFWAYLRSKVLETFVIVKKLNL